MPIARSILAALISIGLVLSPIAVANAMGSLQASVMDDGVRTAQTTSSTQKACPCCDVVGKCVAAAICAMSCAQLGPASDVSFLPVLAGHAALNGIVPTLHRGLARRPAVPPPRV